MVESRFGQTLNIAAVERETGLSKDVLRKWELRYGFPAPLRDSQGERAYPANQEEGVYHCTWYVGIRHQQYAWAIEMGVTPIVRTPEPRLLRCEN